MREVQKGAAFMKSIASSTFCDSVVNQQKRIVFYTWSNSKMAVVKNQEENRHLLIKLGNFYLLF